MDRETEATNAQVRETEALLRRSRPAPSGEFTSALDARLFPIGRRARLARWRARPALLGAAATAATACAAVALSLVGVGPLAAGGSHEVGAKTRCKYVIERRRERVPAITRDANGRIRLTFSQALVERRVKRCR